MNFKAIKIIPAMILLYSLQASVALPNSAGPTEDNSLLINGRVVTAEQFAHVTHGMLTIAKGNSVSNQRTTVPFLIYLKRGGMIVNADSYPHNFAVSGYEIYDILKFAKAGDELIIDPVKSRHASTRKVITVKSTQIIPQFRWFYTWNPKKDNC